MSNTINPSLFLATALTAAGQLIHGWHPSALGLAMFITVFAMPWMVG